MRFCGLGHGACRGAKPLCVLIISPFAKGGYRGIGLGDEGWCDAGDYPAVTKRGTAGSTRAFDGQNTGRYDGSELLAGCFPLAFLA